MFGSPRIFEEHRVKLLRFGVSEYFSIRRRLFERRLYARAKCGLALVQLFDSYSLERLIPFLDSSAFYLLVYRNAWLSAS
ncbi:hypothetical protein C487_09822 [Natrinema pallidum DSM 3751]|uniref:Uncharacterized protein n=2 Tax=Natrinema TaxID=88723 RepID=L9Y7D1_NATP1|nr:hypothetical protein C488_20187 [Natrinema pellirubrum DSM 15624]ELY77020.1 hypothetical protein C487_09822 [Natrinema pallidum DSM 3751]